MSSPDRPDAPGPGRDAGDHDPVVPGAGVQQRFVEMLQDMQTVVWEMDAETWTFTFVSERAERMFGYPLERWTEPGFWQDTLVDDRDRGWCTAYCGTATRERRDHAFIYRAHTADGRTLWLKDVVRVLTDDEGRPTLLRGVMVDVSDTYTGADDPAELVLDYDDPSLEPLRRIIAA